MGRILRVSLTALLAFVAVSSVMAADPARQDSFHKERWGQEIGFKPVDRYVINWSVNFQDFLDEQTNQIKIEVEKFKPVRFIREAPLSSSQRGPVAQLEPEQYPSVQFFPGRW